MVLARLLLLGRSIPTLLKPDPLGRILSNDLLHNRGHLHGELMQIAVAVPRIRTPHDLPDEDLVLAVWLTQDKCGDNGRLKLARENGRPERCRCRASKELDECPAGAAVLVGKEAEQPSALQGTRRCDQLARPT